MALNRWDCDRCNVQAVGIGPAIGLRAIGWYVEITGNGPPRLLCPSHRMDGIPCKQEQSNLTCGQCKGKYEAERLSRVIEAHLQMRIEVKQ
jgi:hypothetical protein